MNNKIIAIVIVLILVSGAVGVAIGSFAAPRQTFSRNSVNRQGTRPVSFNSPERYASYQPFSGPNRQGQYQGFMNNEKRGQHQTYSRNSNWHTLHRPVNKMRGHVWHQAFTGMSWRGPYGNSNVMNRRAPYPTSLNNRTYRQSFTMNRPVFYLMLNSGNAAFTYQNPVGSNVTWSMNYVQLGQQQGKLTYTSGSAVLKVVTVRVTGVSYFSAHGGQNWQGTNRPMFSFSSNQTTTCLAPGNSMTINYNDGGNLLLLFTKSTTTTCNP
jgi:hypothetical protein